MSNAPSTPEATASLGQRLKDAGQLAARHAQRAKLVTMTLPATYKALGRHLYGTKAFQDEFPETYQEFDRLAAEMKAVKAHAEARPANDGIAAKAKAATAGAKDMAQTKALEKKVNQAFGRFGEAVFDQHGGQSGPPEVVKPIADARMQLAALDAEIAKLSASSPGQWLSTKRLALGGFAAVVLLLLAICYGLFGSNDSGFRKKIAGKWTDSDVTVIIQQDELLLSEGADKHQIEAPYSTSPSKGMIVANLPETPDTNKGTVTLTLTDENTLRLEFSGSPGEAVLLHRTSGTDADDSDGSTVTGRIGDSNTVQGNQTGTASTASDGGGTKQSDRSTANSVRNITKKQFIEKMRQTMSRGEISDSLTHAIFENHSFQDTFGDPDSNVEGPDSSRLYGYDCSDGRIQLTVDVAGDTIVVDGMNTY